MSVRFTKLKFLVVKHICEGKSRNEKQIRDKKKKKKMLSALHPVIPLGFLSFIRQ